MDTQRYVDALRAGDSPEAIVAIVASAARREALAENTEREALLNNAFELLNMKPPTAWTVPESAFARALGDHADKECAFKQRGLHCVWYQCTDCAWYSHSADPGWSLRAAEVHTEFLCKGHRVTKITNPHQIPNHADKQTPDA